MATRRNFFNGVFGNRCPSCWEGAVFRGFYSMNERCPSCGFEFVRENGYFLGAMVISYFVAGFSAVPTLVILLFVSRWEVMSATAMSCLQIVLLNPPLFHFARLAWLHMDREVARVAFEKDKQGKSTDGREGL